MLIDVLVIRKKACICLMKMNQETNFFTVREGKGENKLFCNTLWCLFNLHFRKAIVQYGMFHQVRVDEGKEFYLSLFIRRISAFKRQCKPYCTVQTNTVKARMYRHVHTDVDAYTV